MRADQLDLIVVATSTPDYIFPSTACLLQAKLGVKGCAAFDVQAVCSGFVYALATADSFIEDGIYKKALVVGAEVFSRILDWNDRGTCVLFGDGAGAVVLAADSKPGIHASVLHADGSQAGMLSVPGNVCGGAHRRLAVPADERAGRVQVSRCKVLDEVGARNRGRGRHEPRRRRLADPAPGERAHPRRDGAQARPARARSWW